MHQINRRTLLGSGFGALGAAAAGPLAPATEHARVTAAPDAASWATPLAQDYTVVIQKSAADLWKLDGPGLAKLPEGTLVAVVTVEPRGASTVVQVAESSDGGRNWTLTTQLPDNAAVPWEHEGALYVFAHPKGTGGYREDDLMLLRSDDAGRSWSEPVMLFEGHFWNGQTGMAVRDGWLYWFDEAAR